MTKSPVHLVPTAGKKLADVAANVELQAALVSTLLSALMGDNPKIKDKMLLELRAVLARTNLSSHQREIYGVALGIVKDMPVPTR